MLCLRAVPSRPTDRPFMPQAVFGEDIDDMTIMVIQSFTLEFKKFGSRYADACQLKNIGDIDIA